MRCRVVLNEDLNLFLYNFFHEGGQILKMVVERVAVDTAVLYNDLYGNLAQRPLVEQLPKGLLDGSAGKIGQGTPPTDCRICNTHIGMKSHGETQL